MLVPGQTVSAGVCLESFVVATTDKAFVPQFIDRTGNDRWRTRVCDRTLLPTENIARLSSCSVIIRALV